MNRRGHDESGRAPMWVTVGVGVALLIAAGVWFAAGRRDARSQDQDPPLATALSSQTALEQATAQPVRIDVDLREYVASERRGKKPQPISLPRCRLHLALFLPGDSKPGQYEIQVLDSKRRTTASAAGRADFRNDAVTLQTTLDLRLLSAGIYLFGVRREGEGWRLFGAEVK